MSPMPNPKVFDLDAHLNLDDDGPLHTKQIKMFGREWTLVCDVNMFAMSEIASGDTAALSAFVRNAILPEQSDEFLGELRKVRNLGGEKLGALLSALIEAASDRPTVSPSPSQRTAKKPTSVRKSPGR